MTTTSQRPAALPAKEPVSVVAGPYGHPFHPILVTIPIGAWVGSLVLDIASYWADSPGALARGAYWMIGVGIIGAGVAALFGLLDLLTVPRGTRGFRVALAHMTLNVIVLGLFLVTFFVRRSQGFDDNTSGSALALSAVALGLLLVSGWLGGMLSYRYGVRVAREQTQLEGYQA